MKKERDEAFSRRANFEMVKRCKAKRLRGVRIIKSEYFAESKGWLPESWDKKHCVLYEKKAGYLLSHNGE